MKKVMFISSTGGHFNELMQLKELFKDYDYSVITEKTKTSKDLAKKHPKVGFLLFGTKDHLFSYVFKLFANCWISLYYFIKYNPKYIVTTGAHTAGPMCCLGKIFRKKIIFIETFANTSKKTATGKLIYLFADLFIVQWEDMLKMYPKAQFWGWIY